MTVGETQESVQALERFGKVSHVIAAEEAQEREEPYSRDGEESQRDPWADLCNCLIFSLICN